VHCGNEIVSCDKLLLCAGAWSGEDVWPLPLPVRPVAGQMLVLQAAQRVKSVIYSESVYLVPRRDGRLLVGATVEDVGFRKAVTPSGTQALLDGARGLVPELADCAIVEQWAGLRPYSSDGLPILGATPLRNFYVATGHGRNGILLTPITAKLMANCILNNVEPPEAFSPGRFSL
jgi:glycine/D-amino acid oxidase-like deaminating enzyme